MDLPSLWDIVLSTSDALSGAGVQRTRGGRFPCKQQGKGRETCPTELADIGRQTDRVSTGQGVRIYATMRLMDFKWAVCLLCRPLVESAPANILETQADGF